MTNSSKRKGKTVVQLVIVAAIMFGFGYALVPFYDVFCRVTGFGGKTDVISESEALNRSPSHRQVAVSFTTHTNSSLPWEFKPVSDALEVKVGKIHNAYFRAKNVSNRPIIGMATFNVTPPRAGVHFKKTDCFCFTQQILQPGEEREMLVTFMLDSALPEDVHELTLSYTFFDNEKYAGQ